MPTFAASIKEWCETARLMLGIVDQNLSQIGGGAVISSAMRAVGLAMTANLSAAQTQLSAARTDAEKVLARAPFVRACREHEATIKAAFSIAHLDLGKSYKTAWEQVLVRASARHYVEAAEGVVALSESIVSDKAGDVLTTKRNQVRESRAMNVEAINAAMESAKPDIGALRKLVTNEIGSKGGPASFAVQAAEVGDDPGAKSREPIRDAASAEALFKTYDWFALKDMLHAQTIRPDEMWDCWRYRQKYVTETIDALRKQFPTLIAKNSGSTDLESDIDITFASSAPGDDVKAAAKFNKIVKDKFGKPPGRVFDVNIYPRDYNAIQESINSDYNPEPLLDRNIDQPMEKMLMLSRVDQDVATLLKQRRFLDATEFSALMESVIANATATATATDPDPDPDLDPAIECATKERIRKQFEEGEDIFLMTAFEKVDRIKATLTLRAKKPTALMTQFDALRGKGGASALAQAQIVLPQLLDELETKFPDEVMETTDAMYLAKMAQLRKDQSQIALLDRPTGAPDEHPDGDCTKVHGDQTHAAWRAIEAQRLKAQVKKAQFTHIIFANEAYMSEGAIEHVVAGIQAKDPAKKEAALARLTPATLMQSCNEQLADFFKDMKAVEKGIRQEADLNKQRRKTGEAFVHASKYLVRLLDAAQILADKFAGLVPKAELQFSLFGVTGVKSALELQGKVEAVLLALRKSSTVPAGAKGEVGFDEADQIFKVKTIGAFRQLITQFGVELNQQVRRNPTFQAEMTVDPSTQRQYFGAPAKPAQPAQPAQPAVVQQPLADVTPT